MKHVTFLRPISFSKMTIYQSPGTKEEVSFKKKSSPCLLGSSVSASYMEQFLCAQLTITPTIMTSVKPALETTQGKGCMIISFPPFVHFARKAAGERVKMIPTQRHQKT